MKMMKGDGTALTPWFLEQAGSPQDFPPRLSGNVMRNHIYFATAPGNATLFVAQKKNGIVSQLPIM